MDITYFCSFSMRPPFVATEMWLLKQKTQKLDDIIVSRTSRGMETLAPNAHLRSHFPHGHGCVKTSVVILLQVVKL